MERYLFSSSPENFVDTLPEGVVPAQKTGKKGSEFLGRIVERVASDGLSLYHIDDTSYNRDAVVLTFQIRKAGDNLTTFSSAEDALAAIEQSGILPDIVLCDGNMPGMNGVVFFRELEKLAKKLS